jgi:hypothetical protein
MSNLDAAIEYQRRGFSVIPIKAGTKKALVQWEPSQAEPASEATLTHWFTSWPDANVGLVTGAVSDCVVIDLDSSEAKEALKRLAPDYNFSSAPRVRTGRGGYHLFFKHPGVSTKTRVAILPKMDVAQMAAMWLRPHLSMARRENAMSGKSRLTAICRNYPVSCSS